MVGGYRSMARVARRLESKELAILSTCNEYDSEALRVENEAGIPSFLVDNIDNCDMGKCDDTFDGMIFMSNRQTKKECFERKLFGLPISQASIVKKVKPGMKLFLFEYERRQLYGIFEATSGGSLNIERNAYKSSGGAFPAQVRFRIVWNCHPLSEELFKDAISENYYTSNKFHFHLSQEQVLQLICLFSLRKIDGQLVEGTDKHEHPDQQVGKLKSGSRLCRSVECIEDDRFNDSHIVPGRIDSKHHISNLLQPSCAGGLPDSGLSLIFNACSIAPQDETNPTNYQSPDSLLPMESVFANIREDTGLRQGRDGSHGHMICDVSNEDRSLASHSVQAPAVSSGDRWLDVNAIHRGSCARGCDLCEYNLRNTLVSRDYVSDTAMKDLTCRDNQAYQGKSFQLVKDAMDFSGQAVMNATNRKEEMYSTDIGGVHIPSNQHHDCLFFDESGGVYGSPSFNSASMTLPMPVNNILQVDGCERLSQVSANNSHFTYYSGCCSAHTGNPGDGFPLPVTAHPEDPVMQPGPDDYRYTCVISSKSDVCTKKKSVFSRLRLPESMLNHVDALPIRKRSRHFVRPVSGEQENLEPDENIKEIDEMNEYSDNDRLLINFKRRSQVSKTGKENNPDNMSIDDPLSSQHSEGQVHSIDAPHKPKRRKLIRPQFDIPKMPSENAIPAPIEKCPAGSRTITNPTENVLSILSVSEKSKHAAEHVASPTVFVQEMADINIAHDIENKDAPSLNSSQDLEKVVNMQPVSVANKTPTGLRNSPDIFKELTVVNTMDGLENKNSPALDSRQALVDSCGKIWSNQVASSSTNSENNVIKSNQAIADLNTAHDFENKDSPVLNSRQELEKVVSVQPASIASKTPRGQRGSPGIIFEELAVVSTVDGTENKDSPVLDLRQALADSCGKECSIEVVSTGTKIKDKCQQEQSS